MASRGTSAGFIAGITVAALLGGGAVAASFLPPGSVDTEQIRDQAVTNSRIANNAVGQKKLRDGAVTSKKIKDGTIQPVDFSWLVWSAIADAPGRQGPAGAPGATGATGAPGPSGAQGAVGPAGSCTAQTILNGSGPPSQSTGTDGDFYIDTSAQVIYGPKSGSWPTPGTSIVGPKGATGDPGPAGATGATGATGAQGPQGEKGDQGDPGATGATGAQGDPGAKGEPGTSILNGCEPPGPGTGNDGDFYIDTATSMLYGPKASGAWPTPGTSIVGPAGATGPAGPEGPQGPQGPQGPTGGTVPACSAQWSSSQNQASTGAVLPITYDTVDVPPCADLSVVGTLPTPAIRTSEAGRFNMQFSAQIERLGNQARSMRIWPQVGTYTADPPSCGGWANVPNSASTSRQASTGGRQIMTVNFLLDLPADQCVQLVQESGAANEFRLLAEAASADAPAVPSIITNIWRIG